MKYLLPFLFLLPLAAKSQVGLVIDGIGRFKVGSTDTSIIKAICKELGTTVKKYDDVVEAWASKEPIVELTYAANNCDQNIVNSTFSPKIRHFKLNSYELLERYKTDYLSLFFMSGVLYEVRIIEPSHQLFEDLQAKYGKGTTKTTEEQCDCEKDGAKHSFSCERFSRMWVTSKSFINSMIYNARDAKDCSVKSKSVVFVQHRALSKKAYELYASGLAKCNSLSNKTQSENKSQNKKLEDL